MKYDFSLLISKEPFEDVDERNFFEPFLTEQRSKDLVPFQFQLKKTFRKFKIIRVKDTKDIEELRSFIHPSYEGTHRLLFSEDFKFMFEEMNEGRCFFY